jgi:hypothetical protein
LALGALWCAFAIGHCALRPAVAHAEEPPPNAFFHEFFGRRGYADPELEQNLKLGMMNGLTFSPPVEDGVAKVTNPYSASLMLRLAGAPVPAGIAEAAIEQQRLDFNRLVTTVAGSPAYWSLMTEWDQSGGAWVSRGRPRYTGLSRANADARFQAYYESSFPGLMRYLRQPAYERSYQLASVTDYSPNVYRAYELGIELQMLERGIDELGDLSTGIAFLRGAARQYGRPWGMDFSTWRTSLNSATTYSETGVLLGGWSDSYMRRNYYAAFAAGARTIQNEAAIYRYPNGKLNPFGKVTHEFAEFMLRSHPDLGEPVVNTAIMIDHYSGFDPKHGLHNQANAVWYQDIPYSDGDFMTDNFFRLAFPRHWQHGLTPGAPFADRNGVPNETQFRAYLASGGDPRPYEPMPATRWGDNLDVITNAASGEVFGNYKVIVLMGDFTLDSRLRNALRDWVIAGGILVANVAQVTPLDEPLLGVTIPAASLRSGAASRWLPSVTGVTESSYNYRYVVPTTAEVLAVSESSDPLITRRRIGAGEIILTTPDRLQNKNRDQLLQVGAQLLDGLFLRFSPARVVGPEIEYVISEGPGKLVVTLVNNSATDWSGQVTLRRSNGSSQVFEYLRNQSVPFTATRRDITVAARVPAFDLRVFALETSPVAAAVHSEKISFKSSGTEP